MTHGLRLVVAMALALVAAQDSWARHSSRGGGAHRAGAGAAGFSTTGVPTPRAGPAIRPLPATVSATAPTSGSSSSGHHHHFPGRTVIFVGAPYMYWAWPYGYAYLPPPYYYGPDYDKPKQELPAMYVEKFDGTPTAETEGDIFCPAKYAYYPDVKECPTGWQRIFPEEEPAERPANHG